MVVSILVNMKTINLLAKESINGKMEKVLKVSGTMGCFMEKESKDFQMVPYSTECGKTDCRLV